MNPSYKFNRRSLLQGLGATALLAPFAQLPAIRAQAQSGARKRALFVYIPDGCIPDRFHPTGTETAFQLGEMTAPLEVVRKNITFLDGLSMYAGGGTHEGGVAKVLTGVGDKSIDVFLGERLGANTPHRSLQLGVGSTFQNGGGSISFIGAGQPVNPDDDPLNAFSRIFGKAAGGGSPAPGGEDLANRKKKSVLDTAIADLSALKNRLGTTEKEKLDLHLDSLREVEKRITTAAAGGMMTGGGACNTSGFNRTGFKVIETDYYPKTYHKEENFKLMGQMMMDLTTLALSCGSTNSAMLMWSHSVSPTRIAETGVTMGHHDASHYGDPNGQVAKDFIKLKRWFMEQFVYLIQKLQSTPDQGGTLLDNTVVMLCSELGDSNRHDHDRCPFLIAGGANCGIKGGRFLNYRGKNAGENEPHTKLLVSVANAVGVNIDSFGFTGKGKGPLPGLLG